MVLEAVNKERRTSIGQDESVSIVRRSVLYQCQGRGRNRPEASPVSEFGNIYIYIEEAVMYRFKRLREAYDWVCSNARGPVCVSASAVVFAILR